MTPGEVLHNSLDLQTLLGYDFVSTSQRSVCQKLSTPCDLYDAENASEFSKELGFDASRLVAAHNILVASKAADSVSLVTLASLCEGLVPHEHFDSFVRAVCEANAELDRTTFDTFSRCIHFRESDLRTKEWTESVLRDL